MRSRRNGAFALLGVIWGSEWLVTRALELPPLCAQGIRYALAAVLLGMVAAGAKIRLNSIEELSFIAISGISMLALPVLLTNWAQGRISSGLLVVILSMTPLISALMEGRAAGGLLISLVAGIGGTALLVSQGLSFAASQWTGAAATLMAATCIAGSVVALKRRSAQVHPLVIAAVQFAAAAVCVLLASLAVEVEVSAAWTARALGLEIVLAVCGNTLAFPLFFWLLREAESFKMTTSSWLVTIVSVGESVIFVRTVPSWRIVAGITSILLSVVLVWKASPDDDVPVTMEITG